VRGVWSSGSALFETRETAKVDASLYVGAGTLFLCAAEEPSEPGDVYVQHVDPFIAFVG